MKLPLRHILSGLAASILFAGCDNKTDVVIAPNPSVAAGTNAIPAATNTPSASAANPALAKLTGKWQRTDGDYLIQIKGIDSSGKLDVGYFNPKPINVSRAAAFEKDGGTKVFIELRDVNYPGSTYTLSYDPKSDQLFGQYFQAAMQQTFDVTFERVKE